MKLGRFGFRTRLLVPTILISTLCIGSLSAFVTFKTVSHAEEALRGKADEVAQRFANQVTLEMSQAFTMSRSMANLLMVSQKEKSADRKLINQVMRQTLENNPHLLGVWAGWEPNAFDGRDEFYKNAPGHDSTGRFIPYWNRGSGKITLDPLLDYEQAGVGDYYQVPKATHKEQIIEPYIYPLNGKDVMIMTVAVPIIINGVFAGVTGIDFALDRFSNLVKTEKPFVGGTLAILSNKGIYAATAIDEHLNKDVSVNVAEATQIKASIAEGAIFRSSFIDKKTSEEWYRVVAPVRPGREDQPWAFEVALPSSTNSNALTLPIIIFASSSIVVLGLVCLFSINRVTKPLYQVSNAMKNSVSGVSGSANNLTGISTTAADSASEQATAITETAAMIKQITQLVQRSLKSVEASGEAAAASHKAAERGRASMNEMIQAIREIDQTNTTIMAQIEACNIKFGECVRVIERINEKTAVINEIVFQTKLLSFNASVEAARAGDAGKGFAVVAQEIGNLALMSGSAATEIANLLVESTDQVNNVVKEIRDIVATSSKQGEIKIAVGTQLASTCGDSLSEIVKSADHVRELLSGVSNAANEQAQAIAEINLAVTQLDHAIHQTTELSNQTATFAGTLHAESDDMSRLVNIIESEVLGSEPVAA